MPWFLARDAVGNIFCRPAGFLRNNKVGDTISISKSGFDKMLVNTLAITSIPDTEAPEVQSIDLSPASVSTASGQASVTCSIRATDNLSGMKQIELVYLYNPTGDQHINLSLSSRISGDAMDGTCRGTFTLPQNSEAGTWTVKYIRCEDEAGNRESLDTEDEFSGITGNRSVEVSN